MYVGSGSFKVYTGGNNERLRITSDGFLLLGTTDTGFSSGYTNMTIGNTSTNNTGLTIASSASNGYSRLHFADGTSGAARYAGWIVYDHSVDAIKFSTANAGSHKVSINSDGSFQIGQNNNDVAKLEIRYSTVPAYITNSYDGTYGESTFSNNIARTSDGSASWGSFNNTSYGASAIQLLSSTSDSSVSFSTAAAVNTNPTERFRIDGRGEFKLKSNDNNWVTVHYNHNSRGLRRHYREFNAGTSAAQYSLIRIRRHWWGWGHYKITIKRLYYSSVVDAVFYITGHGRTDGSYNANYAVADLTYDSSTSNVHYSGRITISTPSTSSPGDASAAYIDVLLQCPAYMYFAVEVEASTSAYSTSVSNINADGYALHT